VFSVLRRSPFHCLFLFLLAAQMKASDVWSSPSFSTDPAALRQAADAVTTGKHSEVTVLLNDIHYTFDDAGKTTETRRLIYRVETEQGVENWAEISGQWDAWHQSKPEIKARVITTDGVVHWLDSKTLSDSPVHEDAPDLYTDERRYGGPLPAIAPGAIVEREVTIRDTAPLFAAGSVDDLIFGWSVPVNKVHIVLSHPDALPLQYKLRLLPDASVTKTHESGIETITLDQGPLPAYPELPDHVPSDLALRPELEFTTGTSWQKVASEYARLSEDKVRVADVQPLLAKLNLKDGTRNDVVRRIVSTLHKNVRYTGVEFGESSLIPQPPAETLRRRYGDCKDKATLLVTMLRATGIPANLALLQAGPGADVNPDLPGMGMFDHAIVYVPASSSDPELWIDATAQYSQVGTLPWMDYGRLALIVSDKTDSLRKTPELTVEQNMHHELRVFTLAEYGNASISETDEETGPEEGDYREFYSGDAKEVHQNSESYVKDMYLADSLTSLEHEDLSDLQKSPAIKFVTKGRRGNTELTSAVVAIRVEGLFDRLPKYFRTSEDKHAESSTADPSTSPDDAEKPRTADWQINPFGSEWQYKIDAPLGFKIRSLPQDKSDKIDTIRFTQHYSANAAGTEVEAVLRVESPATRMTVDQAKLLRDAVVKVRNSDPIFITFDHIGQSLIAAGKIREGLAAYRDIAAQHPKEALHQLQLAQALLSVGLGDEARAAARQATTLEPNSALAFSTLGTALKNDRIGRLLKKGMDYDEAITAYKKSITLDPKDKDTRANLALLLEYDADGIRYSEKAHLKEAVAQLQDLKKLDEDYERTYEDNILYDLWYAHDFQGVLNYAANLPATDVRRGLIVAAISIVQSTDAALKKSVEITTSDQNRSQVLMNASAVLMRVRKYPETAAMLTEAARGQSNGSQVARSASVLANTKPYSEVKIDSGDPRSVVQQLFSEMLSGALTLEEFRSLLYIDPLASDGIPSQEQFDRMMSTLRSQMQSTQLPLTAIADLAVSNMHYTVDGNDSLGYKLIIEAPAAAAQTMFAVRDGSRYRVAAFSASDQTDPEEIAFLALHELDKNNLPAARTWLDRARDLIHINSGDDPISDQPFPHFWTKGQEADASVIRTAALVLLPSKYLKDKKLSDLIAARDATKTDIDRARLNLVLASAYSAQQRWSETLPVAQDLMKDYPSSLRAFGIATAALAGLQRLDEWDQLVSNRIAAHPDEMAYVRSKARLAVFRGDFAKSREITKSIIDKGQATSEDFNLYAWFALYLSNPIDQDTINLGIRGNDLTKNADFAILHTLGCVYAQAGKTTEARDLLLKAMDALHVEQPNSELWFGFGLIAEQYGVPDAARQMFERVEKPKVETPGTTYSLAQQHLQNLRK